MSCQAYGSAGTRQLAPGDRMPARPTGPGGFRPGADRFHIATLPPSPSEEILPTHSPLTTRVLFPILMLSFRYRCQIVTRGSRQHQINRHSAFGNSPPRCTTMRSIPPPYQLGIKLGCLPYSCIAD
jgi:hypothetical protein